MTCCTNCYVSSFGCGNEKCACHQNMQQAQTKPRNSTFNTILDEMRELHQKKNHDYAQDSNTYSNFELAASFAGVDTEKSFAILCGTKDARITELLKKGQAKNESIEDTLLDRAIYTVLWLAWRRDNATN